MEKFQSLAEVLGVPDPTAPNIEAPPEVVDVDATLKAKDFAKQILGSNQYRESLMRRIVMDELPPAVETLLYHYAYGKPTETYKHEGGMELTVTRIERVLVGIKNEPHAHD